MSKSDARDRGELAIVLHSHMPYVEGFGTWPFGEEWLFEAMASCYLPLIEMFQRWAEHDGAVATVSVTPVLADQLALPAVHDRFVRFIETTRAECHRQDIAGLRANAETEAAAALERSQGDYEHALDLFDALGRDPLGALRDLHRQGTLELWTSAATHAVLPLLETEAGIRLQVRNGVASARERFGRFGGGFWLPECAYRPGLEAPLADAGVVAFCVDQTRPPEDLDCASGSDPSCDFDQPEPVLTAAGAVAVPIDWGTIELVWSDNGYPSNSRYRDYHAHTINGLRPWANSGVPYDHEAGARQARADAHQFIGQVAGRLGRYRAERGRPGLLVVALDTELLGHWWYEGAIWLDAVREQALEAGIALAKLPQALERHEPAGRPLRESTWGQRKDLSTWDSPRVEHLRWPAACAELELVTSSLKFRHWEDRKALAAAVRELLLLQSSDWAFMETRELAADYPSRRVAGHSMAFARALAAATGGVKDSRPVPGADQYLQGLAPSLDLSGLFEPASPLGRQALQAAGGADI